MRTDPWYEQMACRDEDPAIFEEPAVPTGQRRGRWIDRRWSEPALAICKRCPVEARCLDEALRAPFDDDRQFQARMVIGGVTPDEFLKLQRRRR